ncbi:isoprenyl transferase [Mediannikoviicoccus vaginalis]|uniref:isoprenyl transferase n=1 Tax=Mediannikoviicoccus vaginalis TaxID=2899727 RepID=UPI001F0158E3|nr:isoprenyl transferase [Mediannikoviicoccus vaginalis]
MVINSLDELDLNKIPEHVGIILDGNGRWAKKRFMPRVAGHREGMKRVVDIVEASSNLGIKYLSLYAFSTENWKRPSEEVSALMNLLIVYVDSQLKRLSDNNVIVKTIGDISKLPDKSRQAIEKACETTKDNTGMVLNLGLNYGSRSEIIRAVEKIVNSSYDVNELTEENFKEFLDTKTQPDLDLLIRPGGEKRLSNFMLYQVAYAELYFCDTLWPDFKEEELYKAILDFQSRNRRFGGI